MTKEIIQAQIDVLTKLITEKRHTDVFYFTQDILEQIKELQNKLNLFDPDLDAWNKLIADFDEYPGNGEGLYYDENCELVLPRKLKYDESWDWLMSVYDKLSELDIGWKITSKGVEIYTHIGEPLGEFQGKWEINCPKNVLLDAYRAIVDFIKWYNIKKK